MPRKTLPHDNWGYKARRISYEEQENREKALKIPEQLGFKLTPELKREYENSINLFLADKTQYANPPRAREVRAALTRIQKSSESFINALNNIDVLSDRLMQLNGGPNFEKWEEDKEDSIRLANTFKRVATLALVDVGVDKGGNRTDFALKNLVREAADIYEKVKGRKPTISYNQDTGTSPSLFFKLVNQIISTLGYPPHSDEALVQDIKRYSRKK